MLTSLDGLFVFTSTVVQVIGVKYSENKIQLCSVILIKICVEQPIYDFIDKNKCAIFGERMRCCLLTKVMKFHGGSMKSEGVMAMHMKVWI